MTRYPKYKDSGVKWLGKVPEHWETLRIKRAVQLRNERRNDSPEGWPYIGLEDVEPESGKYAPTQDASRQSDDSMVGVFRTGDVLYGKLRPYLRKAIVATQDGVCSTEFLVLSEGRAAASWVQRWLLTSEVTQEIEAGCDGAKMPRADWEHVGSIPMPLPPAAEQIAISSVLDRATTRIDALIEKKNRFVELLKEKRQALITQAVTKGLNPNAKMKDSGVEWIGEVPEHWTVCKLSYRFYVDLGKMLDQKRITGAHSIQYLRNQDVQWQKIVSDNLPSMDVPPDELERYTAVGGDLLVCEGGDVGRAAIWRGPRIGYQKALHRLRPKSKDLTEFMLYLLISAKWRGAFDESSGSKSTISHLTAESFRTYKFALPPEGEQNEIVNFLDKTLAAVDRLCERVERSIALLKERRAAFITAAVTGQIDLREEVA